MTLTVLQRYILEGVFAGADKSFWMRCNLGRAILDGAGGPIDQAACPVHETLGSEALEELLVRLKEFLPRSYTGRQGFLAMRERVAQAADDPVVASITAAMKVEVDEDLSTA